MISRRELLMGASTALLLAKAKAATSLVVRFIQITDTHFGQRNHLDLTIKLIDQINRLPYRIDFAVHTGDIMHDLILDEATVKAGLDAMSGLNMPVYYVPGNHDILHDNFTPTRQAFEKNFGKLLGIHEHGELTVATIYTEPLARSFEIQDFHPLDDLESALKALDGKPAIVCHHTPCVGNLYNDREYSGWPDEAGKEWIALLNRYKVKAVLAGHFHRDEFQWLGKVPLFVCPPVSTTWGRLPAYRIYSLENGRLAYRTQYLAPARTVWGCPRRDVSRTLMSV